MALIKFRSETHGFGRPTAARLIYKGYPSTESGAGTIATEKVVTGYLENWSSAQEVRLIRVPTTYKYINIAFATPVSATNATIQFTPVPTIYTTLDGWLTDVATVHAQGQKVVLSIGGAGTVLNLTTTAMRDQFVSSVVSIVDTYNFDGIDLDPEGTSDVITRDALDDDFTNPTTASIQNFIYALRAIHTQCSAANPGFILSFSPETLHVQAASSSFVTATDRRRGGFLPTLHALRDILSWVTTQMYNSGSVIDRNGSLRTSTSTGTDEEKTNFIVAMNDMLLGGFTVQGAGDFPPLRARQVGIGALASGATGDLGYVSATILSNAYNYLNSGTTYSGGTYTLSRPDGYPEFRGFMLWNANWDNLNTYAMAASLRGILDGTAPPPPVVSGDFYVSTSGLDTNVGSLSAPWRTIQKALTVVRAGQTVMVRGGTYTCGPSSSWGTVSLNPAYSGTSTAPITIRNYPGELPIIQFTSTSPGAAIGAYNRSYIVWRGFEVVGNGPYPAAAFNSSYITISHCHIHGARVGASDNTACIRVGNSHHCLFEHNDLHDARNTNSTANGCAFTLYGCNDSTFQYNDVWDVGSGFHLKIQAADPTLRSDDRNLFYRNYAHDFYSGTGEAPAFMLNSGDAGGYCADDNTITENLIRNMKFAYLVGQRATNYRNHFYQNTVINMTDFAAGESAGVWIGNYATAEFPTNAQREILFYNNIFYSKGTPFRIIRFFTWPPPTGTFSLCNYNCYYSTTGASPQWVNGYTAAVTGLTAWRGLGYDANGINANPLFVNENGADPLTNWTLQGTSPCKATGRNGLDMGCFANAQWMNTVGAFLDNAPAPLPNTVTTTPEAYGAVGNGTTNDQTALVNALSYLSGQGGGLLLLQNNKTYLMTGSLSVPANCGIAGQGTLKCSGSPSIGVLMNGANGRIESGVTVQGGSHVVEVRATGVFLDCTVRDGGSYGFDIYADRCTLGYNAKAYNSGWGGCRLFANTGHLTQFTIGKLESYDHVHKGFVFNGAGPVDNIDIGTLIAITTVAPGGTSPASDGCLIDGGNAYPVGQHIVTNLTIGTLHCEGHQSNGFKSYHTENVHIGSFYNRMDPGRVSTASACRIQHNGTGTLQIDSANIDNCLINDVLTSTFGDITVPTTTDPYNYVIRYEGGVAGYTSDVSVIHAENFAETAIFQLLGAAPGRITVGTVYSSKQTFDVDGACVQGTVTVASTPGFTGDVDGAANCAVRG